MPDFGADLRNRQYTVAAALISEILAADLPLQSKLSSSLHALENVTGHQRAALVLSPTPGGPPALIGHGSNARGDRAAMADLMNVQRILSRKGEKGVVRSVLMSGVPIVLKDVESSAIYVPGDVAMRSEACVSVRLGERSRLALNLENCCVGAFRIVDVQSIQQIALLFAAALEGNDIAAARPLTSDLLSDRLH